MSGSTPTESQQRVVSEALASLDALRPLLADGRMEAAVRVSRDWALPQTYSPGGDDEGAESPGVNPGSLRGQGGHGDPVFAAATRGEQSCKNDGCKRVDASGELEPQRATVHGGRATCPTCKAVWVVPVASGDESATFKRLMSALETLQQAASDCLRLEETCRPITGSAAHQKHLALTGTEANRAIECAQETCEDVAIEGSKHCAACASYLAARPGTAVVTREVIAGRKYVRDHRAKTKVHVTGPLAEQEAS